MATVPNVGNLTMKPGRTPAQSTQAIPDAFGAAQARNLINAGNSVSKAADSFQLIQEKRRQDEDTTNKLEIERSLMEYKKETFNGENGYLQKKRMGAAGITEEFKENWQKKKAEFKQGRSFNSKVEEARVDSYIEKQGMEMEVAAFQHETKQRDEHLTGLYAQRIESNVNDASINYASPESLKKSREAIIASNLQLGRHKNLTSEEIDANIKNDVSAMYSQAITGALANGDIKAARELHEISMESAELSGKDAPGILVSINKQAVIKIGQDIADKAFALYPDDPTAAKQWIIDAVEGNDEIAALKAYDDRFNVSQETAEFERKKLREEVADKKTALELESIENKKKSQSEADAVKSKFPDSMTDGFNYVYANYEGDLQDKVIDRLKQRYSTDGLTDDQIERERQRAKTRADDARTAKERENDVKSQEISSDIFNKFPKDPTAGLESIYQNYQGDLQDKVVEAYLKKVKGSTLTDQMKDDVLKRAQAQEDRKEKERLKNAKSDAKGIYNAIIAKSPKEIEALKTLNGLKLSLETHNHVTGLLSKYYAVQKREKEQAQRDLKRDSWGFIIGGGTIDKLSPDQYAALEGTTISSMRQFEKKRAEDGRGFADATNPATYNALHRMSMEENKTAFADYDISQHINEMTESDYKYWLATQRTVDKRVESERAKTASYTLADRVAKEYMNSAGIDYGKSAGKSDALKAQKVFTLIRSVVDSYHDEGKKIERSDIDKALSELFTSGELQDSGILFDDKGFAFEFMGRTDGYFEITDVKENADKISTATGIPAQYIDAVAKAVEKSNNPINLENMKKVWDARKNR